MKKLFILMLLVANSVLAQKASKEIIAAFKYDDSAKLIALVGMDNLNNCYTINEGTYGLLALAIKSKANNCLEGLLKEESIDIEKTCEAKSPLLYAVKYGRLKMLKVLVNHGADHKMVTNKGRTAKDYAKKYKQNEILEYLISLEEK